MSNWWADRLTRTGTQIGQPLTRTAPEVQAPPQAPPVQPSYQRPPASSLKDDHCPGCGSGNYMASPGTSYMRCYDCGFPIQQSGTGVGATKSDAPSKPATQVKGGGFNPRVIVGRVE